MSVKKELVSRRKLPRPVIRRLPKYLTFVRTLQKHDRVLISSQKLARALGLTSSTVRQDLTHFNSCRLSKQGYKIKALEHTLVRAIGLETNQKVIVVGSGDLGRALVLAEDLVEHSFYVCGLFDPDPSMCGRKVGTFTVQTLDDLLHVVERERVDIGVITVPPAAAQGVADKLILCGVRGLLNLTASNVVAPRKVTILDGGIEASLQELSSLLKIADENGGNP